MVYGLSSVLHVYNGLSLVSEDGTLDLNYSRAFQWRNSIVFNGSCTFMGNGEIYGKLKTNLWGIRISHKKHDFYGKFNFYGKFGKIMGNSRFPINLGNYGNYGIWGFRRSPC